jgi:hypothetical protein
MERMKNILKRGIQVGGYVSFEHWENVECGASSIDPHPRFRSCPKHSRRYPITPIHCQTLVLLYRLVVGWREYMWRTIAWLGNFRLFGTDCCHKKLSDDKTRQVEELPIRHRLPTSSWDNSL